MKGLRKKSKQRPATQSRHAPDNVHTATCEFTPSSSVLEPAEKVVCNEDSAEEVSANFDSDDDSSTWSSHIYRGDPPGAKTISLLHVQQKIVVRHNLESHFGRGNLRNPDRIPPSFRNRPQHVILLVPEYRLSDRTDEHLQIADFATKCMREKGYQLVDWESNWNDHVTKKLFVDLHSEVVTT